MVSQFVYHIHLHYIVEKQFHPASSVHVKHHQATGSHVEDDGRLAHAGLNYSPAASDGYQSCKLLTKKSHFSHETKLLNLLHDNLWTSYSNSIYIIHHLSLFDQSCTQKIKTQQNTSCLAPKTPAYFFKLMFFLSLYCCWTNHTAAKSAPFKYLHEYNFFRIVQDSKVASSNCQ